MPQPGQPLVNSLNNLIQKYINEKAEDSVIAGAKRLLSINYTTINIRNIARKEISFKVRNDLSSKIFDIEVKDFYTPRFMTITSNCNEDGLCRHKVAALLFIAERLNDSYLEIPDELANVRYANKPAPLNEVVINMPAINSEVLAKIVSRADINSGHMLMNYKKVEIQNVDEGKFRVDAQVNQNQYLYQVIIQKQTRIHSILIAIVRKKIQRFANTVMLYS
jgi:hypothetical protein